jgi:hypothetical protein
MYLKSLRDADLGLIIGTGGQPIKGATENSHRFRDIFKKKSLKNYFRKFFLNEIYLRVPVQMEISSTWIRRRGQRAAFVARSVIQYHLRAFQIMKEIA